MLYEFVGICYSTQPDKDLCLELASSVVANTKEEALGLLLNKFPDTYASDWTVLGGDGNALDFGIVETYIENRSGYWG